MKLIIMLLAATAFNTYAQKLPKVQTTSMRAPANIKIDGKLDEWNDRFQAYNSGQHIYYTIANDENNLYLAISMSDMYGTRKMFRGGLTFTIIPLAKTLDDLSITFPFIAYNRPNKLGDGNDGGELSKYTRLSSDPVANKAKIESLTAFAKGAIKDYKEMLVKGVPGVSEPLLSIYNTQDIAVAFGFDNQMRYTYELAIPLKYFQAAISEGGKLKYNIMSRAYLTKEGQRPVKPGPVGPELKVADRLREPTADELFLDNDTDFSGEYTLAK